MIQMDEVFNAIDASAGSLVRDLQSFLRQPSVTDDKTDCEACAEYTAQLIRDAGFAAEVMPTSYSNPMVFGSSEPRPDRPTLLIAGHYDVVAPGPDAAWEHPPFEAHLSDGDILARGASDPKGNVVAGVKAGQILREVTGDLPVNLKFLLEGNDEKPQGEVLRFANERQELLEADAVLLLDAGFTRDGCSPVHLGTAGSLAVELVTTTGTREPYFIWTQIIPDAAYRIVWALASLKDSNERVVIDGFYDDVQKPDDAAERVLAAIPWEDDAEREFWGIRQYVTGAEGVDAVRRLLYEPTCSIHGLAPGMGRPNSDSLIPVEARASVNFHLVPDQDPDDILAKLRTHLDAKGFEDVTIAPPSRSFAPMGGSAESPLGEAVLRAAGSAGVGSYLLPNSFEFGDKWCVLGNILGVEGAMIGIGDPDRRAHFPNEHISVDYFIRGTKWIAAAYAEYAAELDQQ